MLNHEVEEQAVKQQDSFNKFLKENNMEINNFKFIAIGYLDISEEFETGEVTKDFIDKLKLVYYNGPRILTLGFHTCPFCNNATSSTENHLTDRINNIKYMFPEMIFHYIEEHNFKPSDEFIDVIMRYVIE